MKNYLLVSFFIVFLSGCSKHETGCTPIEPKAEEPQIIAYAAKDTIHAVKHSSGIYYEIINPGSGASANVNSKIKISYTGKLLNETIFDQGSNENKDPWDLNSLIEGWQIGIPLIKKGGRIKLIIPSSYAYGCNGTDGIPSNSVLFFDVSLIDFK